MKIGQFIYAVEEFRANGVGPLERSVLRLRVVSADEETVAGWYHNCLCFAKVADVFPTEEEARAEIQRRKG